MIRALLSEVDKDNKMEKTRLSKPGQTMTYAWFILTQSGCEELAHAAATTTAEKLDKRIDGNRQRAKIDMRVQRQLAEQGFTSCPTCSMPVLQPDDPQRERKADIITSLCTHGVRECACGLAHRAQHA